MMICICQCEHYVCLEEGIAEKEVNDSEEDINSPERITEEQVDSTEEGLVCLEDEVQEEQLTERHAITDDGKQPGVAVKHRESNRCDEGDQSDILVHDTPDTTPYTPDWYLSTDESIPVVPDTPEPDEQGFTFA